jgi:hypothetical protein
LTKKIKKPSVSQLLELLAKPALIDWANKQGLLGVNLKEKRKKSLAKGTSLHSQIEHGVFDREIDSQSYTLFMQDKQIIATEKEIETDWFIGRYDVKLSHEGKEYIVDYKSGFKGKIYLEHKLQLVAYTMAEPASIAIVPIPQFHLFPIDIPNRTPYEQMLIKLSELWHIKKEIDNE